jgi:hypothetical protein
VAIDQQIHYFMDQRFCMEKGAVFVKCEFMKHLGTGRSSWIKVACRMEQCRGATPKAERTHIGHKRILHGLKASGLT